MDPGLRESSAARIETAQQPGKGLPFILLLRGKVRISIGKGSQRNFTPLFLPRSSFRSVMGKEQELLEAARTGNLASVEKLLSGKRQSAGTGSGLSGTGGSGNSSGHSAASHPLSSLLR